MKQKQRGRELRRRIRERKTERRIVAIRLRAGSEWKNKKPGKNSKNKNKWARVREKGRDLTVPAAMACCPFFSSFFFLFSLPLYVVSEQTPTVGGVTHGRESERTRKAGNSTPYRRPPLAPSELSHGRRPVRRFPSFPFSLSQLLYTEIRDFESRMTPSLSPFLGDSCCFFFGPSLHFV